MKRALQFVVVCFFWVGHAFAVDYPLYVDIFDFTLSGSFYLPFRTVLKVHPGNGARRYRFERIHASGFKSYRLRWPNMAEFKPEDHYILLQNRAMNEMRDQKYIDQKTYDAYINESGTWRPGQVRFAVAYSALPRTISNLPFPGLPADREFNLVDIPEFSGKVGVSRGSVMVGYGQELDTDSFLFTRHPMSWEAKHPNLQKISRQSFPLQVEISRAVSETSEILPGSFQLPMTALLGALVSEARQVGASPARVLLTARVFDGSRAKRFARFGMRVLNPEIRERLATEARAVIEELDTLPRELTSHDGVMFTTLERGATLLGAMEVSQSEAALASRYPLSVEQARTLIDQRRTNPEGVYLKLRDYPHQTVPIGLIHSSPFTALCVARRLREWNYRDPAAMKAIVVGVINGSYDFLMFHAKFSERKVLYTRDVSKEISLEPGIQLVNISPNTSNVRQYVSQVVLATYDRYRTMANEASPLEWQLLNDFWRQRAQQENSEYVPLSPDNIFDAFPIIVSTESHEIRDSIADLVSDTIPSYLLVPKLSANPSPQAKVSAQPAAFLRFKTRELEALSGIFPERAAENCRKALQNFGLFLRSVHF